MLGGVAMDLRTEDFAELNDVETQKVRLYVSWLKSQRDNVIPINTSSKKRNALEGLRKYRGTIKGNYDELLTGALEEKYGSFH